MWGDVVHLKTMMLNFLGDTAITDAMIAQAMVVDRDTVNGDTDAGNTTINKPSMPDV